VLLDGGNSDNGVMVISVHIIGVDDDMTQDDVGPGTGAHQHDNIDSDWNFRCISLSLAHADVIVK